MAVVEELIREEQDGTLSFGNYLVDEKRKVLDFEVHGDLYYVKTYKDITKLEKNGRLLLEAVPGAAVNHFSQTERMVSFSIEAADDVQITMELEAGKEYKVLIDDVNVGSVKANLAGKVIFSVDTKGDAKQVVLEKING